jgi:probable F420-dependent oxidoreductase
MSEQSTRCFAPGQVGIGITLPVQAQTTLAAEPWEREAGAEEIMRIAQAADRLGFFSVSASDHVAIPRSRVPVMSSTWYEPFTTLAMVAGLTHRIRLFTRAAIVPFRPPLVTAKAAATLDKLSGGRLILGVGAGHVPEEFAALGVPFARRGDLLNQGIDIVKAALGDEYPAVQTADWSVRDLAIGPRPVQVPRPPVWVGGSSRPALRRAAQRADGWFPQLADRSRYAADIAFLRTEREQAHPGTPIEIGANSEPVYLGSPAWDVGGRTISGSAEQIAEALREFVAVGAQHIQLPIRSRSCDELADQLAGLAADVLPNLS